jgi:hypothetical protein
MISDESGHLQTTMASPGPESSAPADPRCGSQSHFGPTMPMLRRCTPVFVVLVGALTLAACSHVSPTDTGSASDDDPMVIRGSATMGARTGTSVGPYPGR